MGLGIWLTGKLGFAWVGAWVVVHVCMVVGGVVMWGRSGFVLMVRR